METDGHMGVFLARWLFMLPIASSWNLVEICDVNNGVSMNSFMIFLHCYNVTKKTHGIFSCFSEDDSEMYIALGI